MFLLLLIIIVKSSNPQCFWQCDNPICYAECSAVCKPPICHIQCLIGDPQLVCNPLNCDILCGTDQDILNSCPLCDVECQELRCLPGFSCEILCEEIDCAWNCQKPQTCPYPRCELQCNPPACEFSGSNTLKISILMIIINKMFI
jgi:hypothetical protein